MSESFRRLKDVRFGDVKFQPIEGRAGFLDCPKVIQDAIYGRAPRPLERSMLDIIEALWPHLLLFASLMMGAVQLFLLSFKIYATPWWLTMAYPVTFLVFPLLTKLSIKQYHSEFEKLLVLYNRHPEVYHDEIFKLAVSKLPIVDFQGRHSANLENAPIGNHEMDLIARLRDYGIEAETTVTNRGRPFVIHQYQLAELGWGKWPNGDPMNYRLDLAILWPERRIKYNIEVDDARHGTSERLGKDLFRDQTLIERGWFVRRLNHKFLSDEARVQKALDEIVGIIFYFAKYADDKPFWLDSRWDSRVQNQRLKKKMAREREERLAAKVPAAEPKTEPTSAT